MGGGYGGVIANCQLDFTKQARLARRSQQDSAARTNPTVVNRTRHTRPDVGAQVEEGATAESAEVISREAGRSIRAGGPSTRR